MILNQNKHFHLAEVYAILLAILGIGLILDYAMGALIRFLCPYASLEQVRRCVAVLPTRLRRVIEGVFFEERQMQSIAAELGVTPSRVSQLCAEGLHHLRSALRALDHDVPVAAGRAS